MRRKSDRKSKSSPEKKTAEIPATRRSHRRRRQKSASSSPEREDVPASDHENDNVVSTPNLDQTIATKQETSNSNSEEEKHDEQPVWQVKSAETPSGGEIQKLKICLARPSSTPERVEKSPRRHRKHRGGTSLSQTDEDSCEEKIKSTRTSKKHKHHDNDEEVVESSSEDKMNKEEPKILDEQNSSDSQQVSSTDIDENSKPNDKEDIHGECVEEQVYTTHISVDTQNHNGPESTISDTEIVSKDVKPAQISEDDSTEIKQSTVDESEHNNSCTPEEKANVSENDQVNSGEVCEEVDTSKSELNSTNKEENVMLDASVEPMDVDPTATTEQLEQFVTPANILQLHSPDVSMVDVSVENVSRTDDTKENDTNRSETNQEVSDKKVDDVDNTSDKTERSTTPEPPLPPQLKIKSNEKENIQVQELEKENGDKTETEKEKENEHEHEAAAATETENIKPQSTENSPEIQKEYNIAAQDAQDSSSEDRSPVRNSVVSVVSQIQQPVEQEPIEEPTYVADPSRKKIKLKEAAFECIQLDITRLSSETVREICPDLKILSLDEIRLEDEVRPFVSESEEVTRKVKKKPFEDKKITIQTAKEFTATAPAAANPMLANRKISIVGDDSSVLHRPPSPAKNEPSPILYIKNLVRPFTLNQLKELLSRTGTIKENGFWINKIKSECYVHYETLEQSIETRNALHGVHWPVANGRRLDVDFGTEEAMEKARAPTESKPEIKPDIAPESKPKEETVDWREERERERIRREQRGVREWDVGKQGQERSPTPPPPSKRRHQSPPSRTASPERKSRKKEDVPSKLLDDLFRKTKATPCIYWLPLSAEMIVIKEEQRRKHMAEHERRLAEIRRVERERERMRRAPGRNRDARSRYD